MMAQGSYEFDPCSIDGSNQEKVTLDNWRPRATAPVVPKSEWRQKQNEGNYNQQPGIDELKKIIMYLKRNYPDHQIMDSFGISSETLVAIKRDCYDPVSGISLDNQSKIYKEFNRLEKRLDTVFDALKFLADNVFSSKETAKRLVFKAMIGVKKKKQSTDEEE